jgi:hypothetical protein
LFGLRDGVACDVDGRQGVHGEDRPDTGRRQVASLLAGFVARARAHPLASLLIGAACLWVSWLIAGFTQYGWEISPALTIAIVLGGTLAGLLVYWSGVPTRLAATNAEFWGGGILTRFIVELAGGVSTTLFVGMALLVLFGKSSPR